MATWKEILTEGDVLGVNGNPVVVSDAPHTVSLGDPGNVQGGGALSSLSSSTVNPSTDVCLVWDADEDEWKKMAVGDFVVNMAYNSLTISSSQFHTQNTGVRWVIRNENGLEIFSTTASASTLMDNGVQANTWLMTPMLRVPDSSTPIEYCQFVAPTANYTQTQTYQLPQDYPTTSGYVLSSTTTGVLSWTSASGGSDTHLGNTDLDNGGNNRTYTVSNGSSLELKTSNSGGAQILINEGAVSSTDLLSLRASVVQVKPVVSSSVGAVISLAEAEVNGYDSVGIAAPNSLSSSYTLTLPADAGTSGQVLSTNGSGTLSWVAQTDTTGFVDTSGTPVANQLAIFTDADTIKGDSKLYYSTGVLSLDSGVVQKTPDILYRSGELFDSQQSEYINQVCASGDIVALPKSATTVLGSLYTIDSAGAPEAMDASSTSTNYNQWMGMSMIDGSTNKLYANGMITIRKPQYGGTFANGGPLYLDPANTGKWTATQPTSTGVYQRIIGYMIQQVTINSQEHWTIWLNPSAESIKLV